MRWRLQQAIARFLTRIAADTPVLFVVDDLQWATETTIQMLRSLSNAIGHAPVLFVGTHRHTESGQGHLDAMLADIGGSDSVDKIVLTGLDAAALGNLVGTASDAQLARIAQQTGGNPFFVREVREYLSELDPATESVPIEIPSAVRDVVRARVDRLPEHVLKVLSAAAVVGQVFDAGTLEELVSDDVVGALDSGVDAGLVAEFGDTPAEFVFTHDLVRHALCEDLSRLRRARLHVRTASAAAKREPGRRRSFDVAGHLLAAGSEADATLAAQAQLVAGADALLALDAHEALRFADAGLSVVEKNPQVDDSIRCDLHITAAQAHYVATGDASLRREHALAAADAARRAGSAERLAVAADLAAFSGTLLGGSDTAAMQLCREARERLGENRPDLQVTVLGGEAHGHIAAGDIEAADALSAQALAIARQLGPARSSSPDGMPGRLYNAVSAATNGGNDAPPGMPEPLFEIIDYPPLVSALFSRTMALRMGTRPGQALETADEVRDLVLGADETDVQSLLAVERLRAPILLMLGDRAGFDAALSEIESNLGDIPWAEMRVVRAQWAAAREILDGDFEAAQQTASEPDTALNIGLALGMAAQRFWIQHELGRLQEAIPALEGGMERGPGVDVVPAMAAVAYAYTGSEDRTAALLRDFVDRDFDIPKNMALVPSIVPLAEATAMLDSADAAEGLISLLEPFAGQALVVGECAYCAGAADRYMGMLNSTLEQWDRAEAHFEAARRLEQALAAPPLVARTDYWSSRNRLRRRAPGDEEVAARELRHCLQTAQRLGMQRLVSDVRNLHRQI